MSRALREIAFGLAALLALAAAPARAQTAAPAPDPAQREMQAVQELLVRATAEFDGPQQSRSIGAFDQIIDKLEGLRRQGTLPPRGREILVLAYEYRGRAYFNIPLNEKAADSFRALVQLQPQHALSKEKVSPKVVDFFNSVKKALVGYLAVSSKPAGARVTLNGEFFSLTDFFPLDVLAGEYTVEISREGYQAEVRTLSIAPRATEALAVTLNRVSASGFFVTEPAGVDIWVDGQQRSTTAGTLSPDLAADARAKALVDPARASARTEVANLSLGQHVVEFRRKCFEPVRRTIDFPEARDYEVEPVRMEDSLASLSLQSDPPGAKIFLDGEAMGLTPRDLDGICAGKHRVEVKHAAGKFIQDVTLAKNEGLTLNCPIRPSLAFLGVFADSVAGERLLGEAEEKLIQNLSKASSLNFVPAPKEILARILDAEKLVPQALVSGASDPDLVRRVTEKLAVALEVQGFLVAVLPEERLQRTAVLHLLAAGNAVSDRWDVTFAESGSYLRFLSALDQKVPGFRPWTGLIGVDTQLLEGVPVLRRVPGSPAEQAGVQPGDVIYAADGKSVRWVADLAALLETKKPKEQLALHLRGPGGERVLEVQVGETPQEIPFNDPTLLYNKLMMDLRQAVEGYPGTEPAAFARLNLALCAMHFSDYAAAHEHLLKARNELPQRPGLSQGTALYYLGLAFERLGDKYRREAADAYRAAAAFKDATLFNNDGPAVAPLASRRAGP
jgi:tetratricopeptide (TPR) repeat protein